MNNKKIHIIAAHTDDEVLGAGGTASELIKKGYEIYITILGKPIEGKYNLKKTKKEIEEIKKKTKIVEESIKKVKKIIGIKKISVHNLPNCQYDSIKQLQITQLIEKDMREFDASIILTHHPGDSNTDHGMVFKSAVIATRSLPNSKISKVLLFEIPSSTTYNRTDNQFKPDTYIEISEKSLNKKIQAMEAYSTESAKYPHPRSKEALKALAMLRGSEAGIKYAEAFQTLWRKGL